VSGDMSPARGSTVSAMRVLLALAALCFVLTVLNVIQFSTQLPEEAGSGPSVALAVLALCLCFGPAIGVVLWVSKVVPKDAELLDPAEVVPTRAARRTGGIGLSVLLAVVLVGGQAIARAGGVAATVQSVVLTLILAALTGVFAMVAALNAFMIRRWGPDA
jgi:hypothetical protein